MKRSPFIHILIVISFLLNTIASNPAVQAQEFKLPVPGVMVQLSPEFNPPILKGIKINPNNPFKFDFILDQGDSFIRRDAINGVSTKLIKYFLASLTIPEKDLWVNLSPYEKNRIIPQGFGMTEMGRDLLAEDYMLKQITASLIYPEGEVGKRFWKRIYEEASKKYGTTDIPVNTFNKVWIIPENAVVYENPKAGTAFVVKSSLKVMLEEDYLAMSKNHPLPNPPLKGEGINALGSQVVREIVIPELTREVNENKNFAQLRQVYNSLILAAWYKKKIRENIFSHVYSNKNKVDGINIKDPNETVKIYERYLQAFKKGVYSYIKETDAPNGDHVPRKYFSGGFGLYKIDEAMVVVNHISDHAMTGQFEEIEASFNIAGGSKNSVLGHAPIRRKSDQAMNVIDAISLFSIKYDKEFKLTSILRKIWNKSPLAVDFFNNLNLFEKSLGPINNERLNWRIYYLNLTAWLARISSINAKTPQEFEHLTNFSLLEGPGSIYNPKQILMFKPRLEDIDLINEWLRDANPDDILFHQDWLDAINEKKDIIAIVSKDEEGVRHLEGWVDYEVCPLYGLYLSHIEIAPWERKRNSGLKLKGLGSLLFAKIVDESIRLGFKGQVFLFSYSDEGIPFFKSLGGQINPGIKTEKYMIQPFYYFSSSIGQKIINAQNRMNGNLHVEDLAMQADKVEIKKHHAVVKDKALVSSTGGIDLTPGNMNLEVQKEIASSPSASHNDAIVTTNKAIGPFAAQLARLQDASGFVPVIIHIQPMINLRSFLGLSNNTPSS